MLKTGIFEIRRAAIYRMARRRAWDRATMAEVLTARGGLCAKSAATLADHWGRCIEQQRESPTIQKVNLKDLLADQTARYAADPALAERERRATERFRAEGLRNV